MNVTLNIGLNIGNSERDNQLNKTISTIIKYELIDNIKVVEKKGSKVLSDWTDERTLVVSIAGLDVSMGSHYYMDLCRLLCQELNQEAIAFMIKDKGYMVFNPSYKGEEYEFNINYFKQF